jgi:hypothetical protein
MSRPPPAPRAKLIAEDVDGRTVLGHRRSPVALPFPIAKGEDGKWAFDTYAGIEEIIHRRIGENESEVIASARTYVETQQDYPADDRDADGVFEYAQQLLSSEARPTGSIGRPSRATATARWALSSTRRCSTRRRPGATISAIATAS